MQCASVSVTLHEVCLWSLCFDEKSLWEGCRVFGLDPSCRVPRGETWLRKPAFPGSCLLKRCLLWSFKGIILHLINIINDRFLQAFQAACQRVRNCVRLSNYQSLPVAETRLSFMNSLCKSHCFEYKQALPECLDSAQLPKDVIS